LVVNSVKMLFGTTTDGSATAAQLNTAFDGKAVAGVDITGKTTDDSSSTGTLTQIIGGASANTLTGSTTADATIDASLVVAND
jgi:hypothetical protein